MSPALSSWASALRCSARAPTRASSRSAMARPALRLSPDVELAEPGAHLGAVARGDQVALLGGEPVAAGRLLLAGDDLDDLAVGERVRQGHDAAVGLGAAAAMAEGGMHAVGEVQRRGAVGQVDDLAARASARRPGRRTAPCASPRSGRGPHPRACLRPARAGAAPTRSCAGRAHRARRLPCRSSGRRRRARRSRASRGCGSAPPRSGTAARSPRCGWSDSRCPSGSRCSRRTPRGCTASGHAPRPAPRSSRGSTATTTRTARTSYSCANASCLRCILR